MSGTTHTLLSFNPRSRAGSDSTTSVSVCKSNLFQSTLPRGERRRSCRMSQLRKRSFNPRSRAGSDTVDTVQFYLSQLSFNPRSRAGSDTYHQPFLLCAKFQSTLPRGERRSVVSSACLRGWFQSTLPRGERPSLAFAHIVPYKFQSTLPRGERRRTRKLPVPNNFFATLCGSIHYSSKITFSC